MNVVETVREMRHLAAAARSAGRSIGLVPTMGALHEGHFSLLRAARSQCGFVVVSIFVNPTQFGPGEDLARYPRTPQADLAACRKLGADAVFMPSGEEMYGGGSLTEVAVPALSRMLCGQSRPWHFGGVCTVVAKLFNIVQPDKAYFGAKDFQQATIIRRMVGDLNFPLEVVVCPIVREADGLAMSSRNAYLDAEQRRQAAQLHQALLLARRMIGQGAAAGQVLQATRDHLAARAPAGEIDYVRMVDPQGLQDVETGAAPVLVALAVKFGRTRLIDNVLVEAPPGRA